MYTVLHSFCALLFVIGQVILDISPILLVNQRRRASNPTVASRDVKLQF